MKAGRLLTLVAGIVIAVFGSRYLDTDEPAPTPPVATSQPEQRTAPSTTSGLIVPDMTVRDMDGRVAWRGDVDLEPVLARIEAGERDSHRNDGAVFGNRERKLPPQQKGYYHEYVVRTPGISHAGPQRVIIGKDGDVWYTPDHYASFRRIR